MVSAFSMGFSTIIWTIWAYSSGSPSLLGNGTVEAKNVLTFSGRLANKGVSNRPAKIKVLYNGTVL